MVRKNSERALGMSGACGVYSLALGLDFVEQLPFPLGETARGDPEPQQEEHAQTRTATGATIMVKVSAGFTVTAPSCVLITSRAIRIVSRIQQCHYMPVDAAPERPDHG
jgi:hypothetical protein